MKTLSKLIEYKMKILKQETVNYFSKYFEIKELLDGYNANSEYCFVLNLVSKNNNSFLLTLINISPEVEEACIFGRFCFQGKYFDYGLHDIKYKENLFENMKNKMIEIEKNILSLDQE